MGETRNIMILYYSTTIIVGRNLIITQHKYNH